MRGSTVRVEAKFKNARLYNAIADLIGPIPYRPGSSVQPGPLNIFCDRYGFSYCPMAALMNLHGRIGHFNPKPKRWVWAQLPLRVAEQLGMSVEDLFPFDLYAGTIRGFVTELDTPQFLSLKSAETHVKLLAASSQPLEAVEANIDRELLRARLVEAMATLTPRERTVLSMTHGLADDGEEHTLESIAQVLGVCRERVRQIYEKGRRKLRQPSRARALKPFIEDKGAGWFR